MNRNRISSLLIVSIAILLNLACQKQSDLQPQVEQINMQGHGGVSTVSLGDGVWQITRVLNLNGRQGLFGDIYGPDEKVLKENALLSLDSLGSIVCKGVHWGFKLLHLDPGTLHLKMDENLSSDSLRILIELSSGAKTRQIKVAQPAARGYRFERIEYFLASDDGDSTYISPQLSNYEFKEIEEPRQVKVMKYGGIETAATSYFTSNDKNIFPYFGKDSIKVPVPFDIQNGDILLSDQKNTYGGITTNSIEPKDDGEIIINVPAGNSKFSKALQWRKRIISYKLTVVNLDSKEPKVVLGKWIEQCPTGQYELKKIGIQLH